MVLQEKPQTSGVGTPGGGSAAVAPCQLPASVPVSFTLRNALASNGAAGTAVTFAAKTSRDTDILRNAKGYSLDDAVHGVTAAVAQPRARSPPSTLTLSFVTSAHGAMARAAGIVQPRRWWRSISDAQIPIFSHGVTRF